MSAPHITPLMIALALFTMGCPEGPTAGPDNFCAGGDLSFEPLDSPGMAMDFLTETSGAAPRPWLITLRRGVVSLPDASVPIPTARFEAFGVQRYDHLEGAALRSLIANPAVVAIEEDRPRYARAVCDPVLPGRELDPWYLSVINAYNLLSQTDGAGPLVAVFDTGIDVTHDDLGGAVVGGTNVSGVGDPLNYSDNNGHGTRVASVIASRSNGLGILGVAPGARLLAVKTQDDTGAGSVSTMIAGLEYAMSQGATIANISVGAPGSSYAELRAVDTAAATGMVIVAAAGNGGDVAAGWLNEPEYPASYRNVISVAATDPSGHRAPFSTYNSFVDVAAPGTSIMGAATGDTYVCDEGTSFSAPQVSGVAALLSTMRPGANADAIKRALVCGATDVAALGRDAETGYGILNASVALSRLDEASAGCTYLRDGAIPFPEGAPDPQPMPSGSPDDGYFRFRIQTLQTLFLNRAGGQGVLLRGQVLTHNGEPLVGVDVGVSLYNGNGDLIAEVVVSTDNEGLFLAFASGASCGQLHFVVDRAERRGFYFDHGGSITDAGFAF